MLNAAGFVKNAVPADVSITMISHGKSYYEPVQADVGCKYRLYPTADQCPLPANLSYGQRV